MYNISAFPTPIGKWKLFKSDLLAKRLNDSFFLLQNDKNKKKLVCEMKTWCGYGCQMHHLVYCLITGYFSKRTVILKSNTWYHNKNAFEPYFKELSENSTKNGKLRADYPFFLAVCNYLGLPFCHYLIENPLTSDHYIIKLDIIDDMQQNNYSYLPPSIDRTLSDKIVEIHDNPLAWWSGQFLRYLLRPNKDLIDEVANLKKKINLSTPCVR